MLNKKIFITAIDTNVGKTIFTGIFAKLLLKNNKNTITHKIVQTGCQNFSEDIKTHRDLMKIDILQDDINGITCPYIFKFPASPHLSAKLENKIIETTKIEESINILSKKYDYILIEGAGGILVPLNEKETTLDFIKNQKLPVFLITSGKLGSINHTLLSLEILKQNKINLLALVFNNFLNENEVINSDSKDLFKKYLSKNFQKSKFLEFENINSLTKETKILFEKELIQIIN